VPDKPRILVIERDHDSGRRPRPALTDGCEVVEARSVARALALLRSERFDGVYVAGSQLAAARWAGLLLQADEVLEAIADGVAVVDPAGNILWYNPEFAALVDPQVKPEGSNFFRALGYPENLGPELEPFEAAIAARSPLSTLLRAGASRYLRLTVTPMTDAAGAVVQLVALARDVTDETQQQQKITAIHKAGEELADLTPDELAELNVEERAELLKYNIVRHMKDLLGLDFIEIRLLDRESGRLVPLLTEGMTPTAASRELYAKPEGNGVTGYVAATAKSYLCRDTAADPLYLEGAAGARSSLTVPLMFHGTVIGTLNVENPAPGAFDERDRQFLEIYGRSVALALTTLELLQAEKQSTAAASMEAISRELALPIDDILSDATSVLDRYAGHDEDLVGRMRHLLFRAREIRGLVRRAGATVAPSAHPGTAAPRRLADARLLVADADEAIRRSAHHLLGAEGAAVETARDAAEAVALARQAPYSAALVDIRLPDLNGFEAYSRLREVRPGLPIILMTGFGYDPTHSIVKARQEGLQTVLYKPFRVDRLLEAVEQALRPGSAPSPTTPPAPSSEGP